MIIGIAIPSLIVLGGSLLTYGYIKNVRDRQSYVQIADDLKGHVLEVRRNEKNFLLHKGEEYYRYCQDAAKTFNDLINSISPKIVREIGIEDFLLLKRSSQTYSGLIYDLYVHYQREAAAVEQVRAEGRQLETVVAAGKHTGELSTDFIFNLRLLEKNYMLFRDKVSFNKLDASLTRIKNILPVCYECVPYIEAVQNLFAVYKKGDAMVSELQNAGNSLEEITARIASGERQKISSFITRTLRLLLTAFVLLCILGPFLVYKTANYIVAPIKRLAEITRKIAAGDIKLRAPIREHDETFTLAESFNTMLDHLQLTQESLEHSMNLLREKQALLVESEKLASLGILTAGVAHELTNPLNNISMMAQTYVELYDKLEREKRIGFMLDIDKEVERIRKIVQNLLSFSKPRKADLKEGDINDVIVGALGLVQNMLHVSNIDTETDLAEDLPSVFVDENQMQQVFVNLFTNAVQAMSAGGKLTIATKTAGEDTLEIDISDTGEGIPTEFMSHLFDPFFTTKGVGGTGLGLSVSYGIIKNHNGNISVKSEAGTGSTFIIELPVFKGEKKEHETVESYGH